MKSAYELAMERLQKQAPAARLTDEQKAKLADLDTVYKAKRAEREVFLRGEIAKAQAQGDGQAYEELQQQLSRDLRRLDEELEAKKEKVRAGK
jgi:stress response protein YsnF